MNLSGLKVAVVHDWFVSKSGGENCVEEFLRMFPQADVFCLVEAMDADERAFLAGRKLTTSFIQRMPFGKTRHRAYLPLMPIAIEQFDLGGYDLIVSSSSAVAKGVLTGPDQIHVSYVHSPIRYAWDLQHVYLRESKLTRGIRSAMARLILHYVRIWDARTAHGVDRMVANSAFVARRIRKTYGRDATVIHPPVDIHRFAPSDRCEGFYVTASRLVPYKRLPMIAEAFAAMPDRRLVVIGDGPDMAMLRQAAGPNVTILGKQPNDVLADHLRRAKAFIFAAEEDFGIAPLEAQASGTPVIAYARGGALETIRGADGEGQTGVFFHEQTPAAIVAAVHRLDERLPFITPAACRANAERFAPERFRSEMMALIEQAFSERAIGAAPAIADASAGPALESARPWDTA